MDTIYLASLEENAGKTLIAAALGRLFVAQGKRVGYLKPVGAPDDPDPAMMRRALGLAEGDVPPPPVAPGAAAGPSFSREDRQKVVTALDAAARSKDVLLIEGPRGPFSASAVNQGLADVPDARVVVLAWYREGLSASDIAQKVADIKGKLAGVLLNAVPRLRLHNVQTSLVPQLEAAGIPVLGVLPQDRALRAPTIREIAEAVEGQILFFPEKADALVEHIMIGALVLDNGRYYFNQFNNKLVVTRWDRPDLQNAALETDTVGFLLTGGQGPIPYMQNRVEEKKLPVIVVQDGTIAVASRLDQAFSRGKLHLRKIERASDLLRTSVRIERLTGGAAS